ncbi:MAG: nucleotide exchange factor GrpE [Anaerolineae bacterium]|nr:nucleotide exchange factor GrpE [Anaerolineae bacterium]
MNERDREPEEAEAVETSETESVTAANGEQVQAELQDDEALPEGDEELDLVARLAEAEARAAEYLDGWQRERAEFANARKRLEKSRVEARQFATIEVISGLLPILDDFQRALDTVPEEIAQNDWYEGIVLVHRKLLGILEKAQIERIASVGEPFDPNVHEAVMQEPSSDHESGMVIRELQSGYRLESRVIRPAMVVVAE